MSKLFTVLGVEIRIDNDFYSVRLGNITRGFYSITEPLRNNTVKELGKLIHELKQVN